MEDSISSVTRFMLVSVLVMFGPVGSSSQCNGDDLVSYHLTVYTFWSQQVFPKHFPDTRPVAQWSKLYGVSHSENLTLFQVGVMADKSLQQYAELGKTDEFETNLNHSRVLSQFYAPPLKKGVGVTSTSFFVDTEHSKVSFVMKIHPSPDWFIGVDRLDLCQNGTWLQNHTIEAIPMDAGTDEGFTFTSPDYANEVPEAVFRITSTFPEEPYGSFYYKNLTQLPSMAQFVITKAQHYVKKPDNIQHTTEVCPDIEAIQNITKTLIAFPTNKTFVANTTLIQTNESTANNSTPENNTTTEFPNKNTAPLAELETIINQIELKQNTSTETLNATSSENSSEFKLRKRRKRKNRQNMKSVIQMLKEILNNEQNDSTSREKSGDKQKGNKDPEKTKPNDGTKKITKQARSAKGRNKTSKQHTAESSDVPNKKRHQQSKSKKTEVKE